MKEACAFAPASVGNVAVGFDVLGLAIDGPGDRCVARRRTQPGVSIRSISGIATSLPVDAQSNTAGRAVLSLLQAGELDFGVELELQKGIPLGSGMGGSAASAVAAVVAVNALLEQPLDNEQLLVHALAGEALASGGKAHADNVAPSLYGGLTLVQHRDGDWHVLSLPTPDLVCVVVHPHLQVNTSDSRSVLDPTVSVTGMVEQVAAMGGFVAGCFRNDLELIRHSLRDAVIESQRVFQVPGFRNAQSAALDSGALGCSFSGSGPSMFAWALAADADRVAAAMRTALAAEGAASSAWISSLQVEGARVEQCA